MMRLWICVAAVVFAASHQARAVIGTNDNVPAATLLLPLFEVDLDNPEGRHTVLRIQNATAYAALTRVTLWSDAGLAVHGFNVYLTGYDVQPVDLRRVLAGTVPVTASAGQDPGDAISPRGPNSQDINFAGCNAFLPVPAMSNEKRTDLQAALIGKPVSEAGGKCVGLDHGDRIARGYVTIDVVTGCSNLNPSDPGYFTAGGFGVAANLNWLLGNFAIVEGAGSRLAAAGALVHIEASRTDERVTTPGAHTFYGGFVGWSAADNREPLPTVWAAPYREGRTEYVYWRDPRRVKTPFSCAVRDVLDVAEVVAFDMQENPVDLLGTDQGPRLTPFPAHAGRVLVGSPKLPVVADVGWMRLNLQSVDPAAQVPGHPLAHQSYVFVVDRPEAASAPGVFGTSQPATALDSALDPDTTILDLN